MKKTIISFICIIVFVFVVLFVYSSLFLTTDKAVLEVSIIEVKSKISGSVVNVNFDNNSHVQKGEILAQIDSEKYQKSLESAIKELEKTKKDIKSSSNDIDKISNDAKKFRIDIDKAKSELERANNDFIRYKNAYKDGSVTNKDLENAIRNLDVARNNYITTQNNLNKTDEKLKSLQYEKNLKNKEINNLVEKIEQAKLDLSYSTIISPVEGTVINKNIETGKEIKAEDKVLSIAMGDCFIVADFGKNFDKKFKENLPVRIKINNNKSLNGKIVSISGSKVKIKSDEDISEYIANPLNKISVRIKILKK